jgi:GNAT superfamily N-acetyltransferase
MAPHPAPYDPRRSPHRQSPWHRDPPRRRQSSLVGAGHDRPGQPNHPPGGRSRRPAATQPPRPPPPIPPHGKFAPVPPAITIRLATPADVPALKPLIEASVRNLQTRDYTAVEIEGALASVFGVDTQLIADGTYFVAESADDATIAGCGGWSKRRTLFGADHYTHREDELLDPATEAAKIRAFFVHPEWARRGVGTAILDACESAAIAAGFTRFEMGATLTGVPFYAARGYRASERFNVPLKNGETLPIVRMKKALPGD